MGAIETELAKFVREQTRQIGNGEKSEEIDEDN